MPTPLLLELGANDVSGRIGDNRFSTSTTVGSGALTSPVNHDADIFTLTVPSGLQITGIFLDAYSFVPVSSGGADPGESFLAYVVGSTFPSAPTAGDLDALETVNADSLDSLLGVDDVNPLGAGTYTFLFQETAPDTEVSYLLSFTTEAAPVPEPSGLALLAMALPFCARRRR